MPQQIYDRFIRIKGLRINYVKIGEGKKNLIVLPGGAGPVHFYLWIINARLAREYTAYFLNPPGFGRSNPAPQPWGVVYGLEFLDEFIEKMCIKRLTIFGHSMGGALAASYAAEYPSKVEKLILCSPLGLNPYTLGAQRLAGIFRNKFCNKQYFYLIKNITLKYGPQMILRLLTPRMLKTFNLWTKTDFRPYFQKIMCETVLIWGDQDTSSGTSFEHFHELKRLIPHCHAVQVRGSEHGLPITEPMRFQSILIAYMPFLQS